MALREEIGPDARHERDLPRERHGRHGRPKPFGGRLRLPTLRFSGAAMAMSTVVGISIATTWLLHEQQGVGRRAGVAQVGSSPPPTPGADRADAASAPDSSQAPAAPLPSGRPSVRPAGPATSESHASHPPVSGVPAPRSPAPGSAVPLAEGRTGGRSTSDTPSTQALGPFPQKNGLTAATAPPPTDGPSHQRPEPVESGQPLAARSPEPPKPLAPAPGAPGAPGVRPPADPTDGWTGLPPGAQDPTTVPKDPAGGTAPGPGDPDGTADHALTGAALVQSLGRDGTRHVLTLTVTEPLTALQAELRLAPDAAAPGGPAPDATAATSPSGTAWTDLAGAVVTTHHERGTLVYRFTTPPGTDVTPGRYTFGVRHTRPAATPGTEAPATGAPTTGVPGAAPAPAAPGRGESAPTGPGKAAPAESWSASAFGIHHPRAVAALGAFAVGPS
ncbi:hypothetical protein ABT263_06455 [Kitasatospora sp. NPDC001603]|uniref:hypothetical protein n=1 Tax=Kitasatospora sp. NPDC001603 TaxID=3154388 RepID=UPI00331C09D7